MSYRQRKLSFRSESAQGATEYIIAVILIAIVLIVAVRQFGQSTRCQFSDAAQQIDFGAEGLEGCPPPDELAMGGGEEPPTEAGPPPPPPPASPAPPPPPAPAANPPPATGSSGGSQPPPIQPPLGAPPPAPAPAPAPPPSPAPPPNTVKNPVPPPKPIAPPPPVPPGSDPIRHHVGDGKCDPALCGGGLKNEGVTYNKPVQINRDQAQAAGIAYVKISVWASGIDYTNNYLKLTGVILGALRNGYNEFIVPITQFPSGSSGSNISIEAGFSGLDPRGAGYDDFEFWNLSVTWHP